jgi:hypothetical protein
MIISVALFHWKVKFKVFSESRSEGEYKFIF